MTAYDWLLIFSGVGIVVLFAVLRMVRALFALVTVWTATLLSAALYQEAAFRLQAVASQNPTLVRGLVFDSLLLIFFIAGLILVRIAFPVTKLPSLGILDHLMGLALGGIVAVIMVALLVNSLGVMILEPWETDEAGWAALRSAYLASGLRPFTAPILATYSWAFVPFFQGLPPVLLPQ